MKDVTGAFELWLEFEHVEDVIEDFCNIRVELADGTAYALNVWTFDFFLSALRSKSDLWPELEVGYSLAPDLFVTELTRPTITTAVADLIAIKGLPHGCLDKPDFIGGEEAWVTIRSVGDLSTKQLLAHLMTRLMLHATESGEKPAEPLDLAYVVAAAHQLFNEPNALRAVLDGQDVRGYPEDEDM